MENTRYRQLSTHQFYTAGDPEQFINKLKESELKSSTENLSDIPERLKWEKYKYGDNYMGTFEYLFYKFKKGIYVCIQNSKLETFLPFTNIHYENEYSSLLCFDQQKYKSFEEMYNKLCQLEGRKIGKTNRNTKTFFLQCLVFLSLLNLTLYCYLDQRMYMENSLFLRQRKKMYSSIPLALLKFLSLKTCCILHPYLPS